MNALANRLKEPSSWAGVGVLVGALGLQVAPDTWHSIVQIGTGIAGLLAVILKETGK